MRFPYATVSIAAISVILYFLLSEGHLYIYPFEKMLPFGAMYGSTLGILTYSFLHIGLKHLTINLSILLVVGTIVENKLGGRHTLQLFLFTGIISGLLYVFIRPYAWVAGSSAGIAGLLTASYIVNIKKTIPAFLAVSLFVSLIAIPTTEKKVEEIKEKKVEELNQTIKKEIKLNQSLQEDERELKEKKERGENVSKIIKKKEELASKLNETKKEKQKVAMEKEVLEKGVKKEEITPPSSLIHLLGALSLCV